MHGRLSAVYHDGSPLFAGIPQGFQAVRYHSLCVARPLPAELEPIAWTERRRPDGRRPPRRGRSGASSSIPESICTEHGRRLLANFRDLTPRGRGGTAAAGAGAPRGSAERTDARAGDRAAACASTSERLDRALRPRAGLRPPLRRRARTRSGSTAAGSTSARASRSWAPPAARSSAVITYDVADAAGAGRARGGDARSTTSRSSTTSAASCGGCATLSDDLPFDLNCGFVGYFGYELKADCEGDAAHESSLPDAGVRLRRPADRLRPRRGARPTCSASPTPAHRAEAERWIARDAPRGSTRCRRCPSAPRAAVGARARRVPPQPLARAYLDDIRRCKEHLRDGETYEVCLTNKVTTDVAPEPLPLYRTLRRVNPAPFSAFLRFGDAAGAQLLAGAVPAHRPRPLGRGEADQGHRAARRRPPTEDVRSAEELRTSEKNRAENLMITDLLRNDLGIVCEIGTVHVPHLMEIETYETVHQLVSTDPRAPARRTSGRPDCIRACFPGGSMTGAPKKRTMEIIDELEHEARGVYSGAIGYLGLSGGCRPQHRDPHDRDRRRRDDDRRRRRDRHAVGPRGRVPGDAAQGRGAR